MRIQTINNTNNSYISLFKQQDKNKVNKEFSNYTSLPELYGRDILTFKSSPANMAKKVLELPFEEKLAYAFDRMETADFLFIVKEKAEVKKLMKKLTAVIENAIPKFYILEDKSITENFIIGKNHQYDCFFINSNDIPIVINNRILKPLHSTLLLEGDEIKSPSINFKFKYEPETDIDIDLDKYSSLFLNSYNYVEDYMKIVKDFNKKILKDVFAEEKETTNNKLSFASIGGQDSVIEALKEHILFPLRYPEVFKGFQVSHGAILSGPPGTGKTLIAQALAAESGASVFEKCATEFGSKFVGESEKNCRELFEKAIEAQPSIIFLDEIDALTKERGGTDTHGDKLLNQFLSNMSDIEKNNHQVFVIGATNKIGTIDSAITRSGRFDLVLECKVPDLEGVRQIFKIHTKNKPIDENIDSETITQKMFDKKMTGADIAFIIKNAFSNALKRTDIYKSMNEGRFCSEMMDYFKITNEDFYKAIDDFKSNEKKRISIGYNK